MPVFDTNVLLDSANEGSEFHELSSQHLHRALDATEQSYLPLNVCYEFLRTSTHVRVFRPPWNVRAAWSFISALLRSPAFSLLLPTPVHPVLLSEALSEYSHLRANAIHDLHTVVLMREHGLSQICTRDSIFHIFPALTVINPTMGPPP